MDASSPGPGSAKPDIDGKVSKTLSIVLFSMEVVMIAIFMWSGRYGEHGSPRNATLAIYTPHFPDPLPIKGPIVPDSVSVVPPPAPPPPQLYPMFQDVHVMIFVGFGFLMTFLQRYGFGAVGFNFLIAGYVVQWAMIIRGLTQSMSTGHAEIVVDSTALITADFVSGTVLISFGAVLGKTSPLQLICMATIEVIVFCVNEFIGVNIFGAVDIGGSIFIHSFGAYFGLAVARVLVDIGGSIFIHSFGAYFGLAVARVLGNKPQFDNSKEGSVYHSDLFSMIGTVFLWMYWPSFNSVLAPGDSQYRAIANTYLSIAASCITAFALSPLVNNQKLNMVHIQNATLAGGVAVGAVADMVIQPWGAAVVGGLAGIVSVLGYQYLTPLLADRAFLHDTCGVNNLHGMPGLMAGVASVIAAFTANRDTYQYSLCIVFPLRCKDGDLDIEDRSGARQAMMQAAALGVTLVIAIAGGILTGFLIKYIDPPKATELYEDSGCWDVPDGAPIVLDASIEDYQLYGGQISNGPSSDGRGPDPAENLRIRTGESAPTRPVSTVTKF